MASAQPSVTSAEEDDETPCDAAARVCENNGISSMMELMPSSLLFSNISSSMEMRVSPEYATITEMCATICACGDELKEISKRAVMGAAVILSKRLVPASVAIEDYFTGDDDEVYEMVVLLADDEMDQQTQLIMSVANVEFDGFSETLIFRNATIVETETAVFLDVPPENRRRHRRKLQEHGRRRLHGNSGLTIAYDREFPAFLYRQ